MSSHCVCMFAFGVRRSGTYCCRYTQSHIRTFAVTCTVIVVECCEECKLWAINKQHQRHELIWNLHWNYEVDEGNLKHMQFENWRCVYASVFARFTSTQRNGHTRSTHILLLLPSLLLSNRSISHHFGLPLPAVERREREKNGENIIERRKWETQRSNECNNGIAISIKMNYVCSVRTWHV